MMLLKTYWRDFLHVLFPETCAGCDTVLLHQEKVLCSTCLYHLPKTDFHSDAENESAKQLWGKLEVMFAVSMLHMPKSSFVEKMIYKFKYQNQPHIGVYIGEMYGKMLADFDPIGQIDLIVPVPIHPYKRRERGYNQSAYFAQGLSKILGIPMDEKAFIRTKPTASQTQKSRDERYENVENVFACIDPQKLNRKNILLVDDVMTTGATISSAGNALIDQCGCKVAVATIVRA